MMPSCVVVGALCEDIVVSAGSTRRGIGGTAYYFAAAFSALGGRIGCVTKAQEGWMVERLREAGVGTEAIKKGDTCSYELSYRGAERSLRILRHSSKILSRDVPRSMRSYDGLHIGPVEEELDASIWDLGEAFDFVSLDVQGLARTFDPNTGNVETKEGLKKDDLGALGSVDVVKFGEEEARCLLGQNSNWGHWALRLQRRGVTTVIITLGHKGAVVYEGGRTYRIPAYPSKPIDWTGAGDCFMAGFAFRRLDGLDSKEAARFGSALAACVIESPRPLIFPSLDDVVGKMEA